MKGIDINYFKFGLLVFYLILLFAPLKILQFSAYAVVVYFFYLHAKKFDTALLYSLILAFFSELGFRGNLFVFSAFAVFLIPLSWKKRFIHVQISDILVFLFFLLHILVFIVHPTIETVQGVVVLGEIVVIYFLLRLFLKKTDFKPIMYLFLSTVLFQSLLGFSQMFLGHNVGILSEATTVTYPYGLTASEDENLFRITASYAHANMYATILLVLLPFLFVYQNWFVIFIRIFWVANLVFTHSRIAWGLGFVLFVYLSVKEFLYNFAKNKNSQIIKLCIALLSFFVFLPIIIVRSTTIPQALEEYGSFGFRLKLAQESVNLIKSTPLFGIGIDQFQKLFTENTFTNDPTLQFLEESPYIKIHNLLLEIAVSSGLPAFVIFSLFIATVYVYYFKAKAVNQPFKKYFIISISALLIFSQFHPIYLVNQFRLFFLLAALILV